jgi:hypothetical protein
MIPEQLNDLKIKPHQLFSLKSMTFFTKMNLMLDQYFCSYLEYEVTKAFSKSPDNLIKHLWCDGILLPAYDKEILKKKVNDTRQIAMTAFIGKDGQDKYELTIKFGSKSLSRYERGLDIKQCIPDPKEVDWYNIDIFNKRMTIYLL